MAPKREQRAVYDVESCGLTFMITIYVGLPISTLPSFNVTYFDLINGHPRSGIIL